MKRILLGCILAVLSSASAQADWFQWTIASGGNDHYYQAVSVPTGIDWLTAESQAQAMGGYLATLTSTNEDAFVYSLISTNSSLWVNVGTGTRGPWIGGFQTNGAAEPAGGWTWVTGEPFVYSNWAPGEPNNSGGNENYLHFLGDGNNNFANSWNDLAENGTVVSFVVEANSVPEPGLASLCGISIAAMVLRRRGKSASRK